MTGVWTFQMRIRKATYRKSINHTICKILLLSINIYLKYTKDKSIDQKLTIKDTPTITLKGLQLWLNFHQTKLSPSLS